MNATEKAIRDEAAALIEAGRSMANAGYFMKRVLRENELSRKAIERYNAGLFKKAEAARTAEQLEQELERLKAMLEKAKAQPV